MAIINQNIEEELRTQLLDPNFYLGPDDRRNRFNELISCYTFITEGQKNLFNQIIQLRLDFLENRNNTMGLEESYHDIVRKVIRETVLDLSRFRMLFTLGEAGLQEFRDGTIIVGHGINRNVQTTAQAITNTLEYTLQRLTQGIQVLNQQGVNPHPQIK